MGDLYARRVLEPSTLKCAPVKSSNHMSLPWRSYTRLTRTHAYTHAQRRCQTQSWWRWVSEECVLWAAATYSSFQKLLSGLNQSHHTLTLETTHAAALCRMKKGQNVTFFSRQDTHTAREIFGQKGKNKGGQDKTNIWMFT